MKHHLLKENESDFIDKQILHFYTVFIFILKHQLNEPFMLYY